MKSFWNKSLLLAALLSFSLAGCKKDKPTPEPEKPQACELKPEYSLQNAEPYTGFENAVSLGEIKDWNIIREASGLAASTSNPKLLFVHNDSGHPAILYAIDFAGNIVAAIESPTFAKRDWEDMAGGPGPVSGINYLYIADIGDNLSQHNEKQVYRFPEPDVSAADSNNVLSLTASDVEVIRFTYPNGSHDAESFLVDPLTKDFYIISKSIFNSFVYRAAYPYPVDSVFELELVGRLPITLPTAADFSTDGKWLVVRGYKEMYLWERKDNEEICKTLIRSPKKLPLAEEEQGEAFTFQTDMETYFTLSEMRNQVKPVLYTYPRK